MHSRSSGGRHTRPALAAGHIDNPFLVMITQSSFMTYPLAGWLNRLAGKSDQVKQRLQAHVNETVCFRIDPLASLSVTITQDGHFKTAAKDAQAAVILDIPAGLIPRIASGEMTAFDDIIICGDPELADTLLYMGKLFQAEIEENLSSIMGDILARRVILTGQELVRWHLGSIRNLSRALSEFLSEEQPVTTSKIRLHQLASETESLQQRISRLEKRITALVPAFSPAAGNLSRTGQ